MTKAAAKRLAVAESKAAIIALLRQNGQEASSWSVMALTPEEILAGKEARELVAAKLLELPDCYRIVLLLRDIEGLSTEETARLLATTEGAVKVRLHRARAAFRALVEPVLRHYV